MNIKYLIPIFFAMMSLLIEAADISEQDAEDIILDRYDGKIIDTRIGIQDGKEVYMIQVLIEGRKVRIFYVDTSTGRLVY